MGAKTDRWIKTTFSIGGLACRGSDQGVGQNTKKKGLELCTTAIIIYHRRPKKKIFNQE